MRDDFSTSSCERARSKPRKSPSSALRELGQNYKKSILFQEDVSFYASKI